MSSPSKSVDGGMGRQDSSNTTQLPFASGLDQLDPVGFLPVPSPKKPDVSDYYAKKKGTLSAGAIFQRSTATAAFLQQMARDESEEETVVERDLSSLEKEMGDSLKEVFYPSPTQSEEMKDLIDLEEEMCTNSPVVGEILNSPASPEQAPILPSSRMEDALSTPIQRMIHTSKPRSSQKVILGPFGDCYPIEEAPSTPIQRHGGESHRRRPMKEELYYYTTCEEAFHYTAVNGDGESQVGEGLPMPAATTVKISPFARADWKGGYLEEEEEEEEGEEEEWKRSPSSTPPVFSDGTGSEDDYYVF